MKPIRFQQKLRFDQFTSGKGVGHRRRGLPSGNDRLEYSYSNWEGKSDEGGAITRTKMHCVQTQKWRKKYMKDVAVWATKTNAWGLKDTPTGGGL